MDLAAMMWVWQGNRVNSWLAGCIAGGWLMWCCSLVVEAGSWYWFGAATWWWKFEADADLVLLPGGRNWKLMLIWYCCLVVGAGSWCWFGAAVWWWKLEADFGAAIVAWISWAVQGLLGCADSLIFADFVGCLPWVSLWVWSGHDSWQMQIWLEMVALTSNKMFKNRLIFQIIKLKTMSICCK